MKLSLDIENLSPVKKGLLLVLPPLIIIALAVVLHIKPSLEAKSILLLEIEKQEQAIIIAQKRIERLPSLRAEYGRLKDELLVLQLQLPKEWEVTPLLKQVSDLATRAGLEVALWRPGDRSVHVSEKVYEIPVVTEMSGTYHIFAQFFSEITRLDRIVTIRDISMEVAERDILRVRFITTTYTMKEI
ncbi:MAG: type 4a pilus biogenesis protein PilO [Thermodesulfovibrionales bacterium]|nr:type 4a pilus biogenesis protein PilO [Thermodesulfovibrionales bacterium]